MRNWLSLRSAGVWAVLVAGSLVAGAPAGAATLDQQQLDTSDRESIVQGPSAQERACCPAGAFSKAQSFTAGISGALGEIQLHLFRESATSGPLTVEIRNMAPPEGGSTLPGSTVLASAAIPASGVPVSFAIAGHAGGGAFVPVVFSTPATVVAGTQYAIVAYAGGADRYAWGASPSPAAYAAGNQFASGGSPPTTWGHFTGGDHAFRTYVTPPPPPPPAPATCPQVSPTGTVSKLVWSLGQTLNVSPVKQLSCSLGGL